LENLEEMDKFLDTGDHQKLNQRDINHLNRYITSNEVEAAIVSHKRKVQELMELLLSSMRPLKNYQQHSLNISMKQKGKKHCQTLSMKPVLHS
jgi:hypothetical protein